MDMLLAFILLGDSLVSEFYVLHFGTSVNSILRRWKRQSVLIGWHIKFRHRGITQKNEYNVQNMAKV